MHASYKARRSHGIPKWAVFVAIAEAMEGGLKVERLCSLELSTMVGGHLDFWMGRLQDCLASKLKASVTAGLLVMHY